MGQAVSEQDFSDTAHSKVQIANVFRSLVDDLKTYVAQKSSLEGMIYLERILTARNSLNRTEESEHSENNKKMNQNRNK